jgi:hypothetical protein
MSCIYLRAVLFDVEKIRMEFDRRGRGRGREKARTMEGASKRWREISSPPLPPPLTLASSSLPLTKSNGSHALFIGTYITRRRLFPVDTSRLDITSARGSENGFTRVVDIK